MGNRQETWTIGEGGDALLRIPADFEQSWTHFKDWSFAYYLLYAVRQGLSQRMRFAHSRGGGFLKYLHFEVDTLVFGPVQPRQLALLLFCEVFLRVDPAIHGEATI